MSTCAGGWVVGWVDGGRVGWGGARGRGAGKGQARGYQEQAYMWMWGRQGPSGVGASRVDGWRGAGWS